MAGLAGPLSHLMRPLRAFASTGGLIVACLAVPSVSQAATVNLDYAGNPVYCSGSCLDATHTSAGTVEVTVVGNNLHFDVDLASGFTFMANHNTTFAFGLDVTGASITNIVSTPGGSWTPQTSVNAGDGVTLNNNPPANTLWPYGLLLNNSQSSNDLEFDVSAAVALTLNDITTTFDKNGVALLFIADVNNNGATGYVGTNGVQVTTFSAPTPLPAALPLMGSMLGAGYLVSMWRRRRSGGSGAAAA